MSATLKFVKLSKNAYAPSKGSTSAAGLDLHTAYAYEIDAMDKVIAMTDLQIKVPVGCYGRIAPRFGLTIKHFIDVGAGVIDADFRGNVGVVLFNLGRSKFLIKKGDRIAQLICEKIEYPILKEVTSLDNTERGESGFGSSGV